MRHNASKREFLKRASAIAATGVATPWALNLASVAASAAHAAGSDYKALVCIFMYGGNDNHNTVVPLDAKSHAAYVAARGGDTGIALRDINALRATALVPNNRWTNDREMALHPQLGDLSKLFDAGKLSLAMNVGPLMKSRTTRTDFTNNANLPPKLFSHNDQQSVWQAGAGEGANQGWGGLIGDALMDDNSNAASFTCISASGNAVFLSGREVAQYQVSTDGAIEVVNPVFGRGDSAAALREVMGLSNRTNYFDAGHADLAKNAIAYEGLVSTALQPIGTDLCRIKGNSLSNQLNIVARLIKSDLGTKRQVFFVSLGGFDHHDGLIERQQALMSTVGPAMAKFQTAVDDMGLSKQVTTFTASDFGRTLTSNGDGSDHGWGSHHLVMGGSVKPKSWVGQLPVFDGSPGGIAQEQQVGNGRLLPLHSVDEYGATFAKWVGVTPTEMSTVFPNLGSFETPDLGFLLP
jgi:uncharacterized protein (DUF1501 family)